MDFINNHILTAILLFPVLAAMIILFLPKEDKTLVRWFAFVASLIPLALSILLWVKFDSAVVGFQFTEKYVWYQAINSSFSVGVDGLSLTMVLLTTLLTPLAILASFKIEDRSKLS